MCTSGWVESLVYLRVGREPGIPQSGICLGMYLSRLYLRVVIPGFIPQGVDLPPLVYPRVLISRLWYTLGVGYSRFIPPGVGYSRFIPPGVERRAMGPGAGRRRECGTMMRRLISPRV